MVGRRDRNEHVDPDGPGRREGTHDEPVRDRQDHVVHDEAQQREAFGGINWGAGFFGWLVAIAVAVLLSSIIGAVATAVGAAEDVTLLDVESEAGTVGVVAAVVLLAVLMLAYYTGGYVAGRMSRFDGGKQGLAVWLIGLLVTLLAVALGAVFGSEYNIMERVSLPTIPVSADMLSIAGAITALVVIVGTILAAMLGGKVGRRYHRKVDRAGFV